MGMSCYELQSSVGQPRYWYLALCCMAPKTVAMFLGVVVDADACCLTSLTSLSRYSTWMWTI